MASIYLVEGEIPKLLKVGTPITILREGEAVGVARITFEGIEFTDTEKRTFNYSPRPEKMTQQTIGNKIFRIFF